MIDVEFLIDLVSTNTDYTVEYAKNILVNLENLIDLPKIYIGYATIDSTNPNAPIEHDTYSTHGEDLVQSFDIHIICLVENYPEIWRNVYSVLIGQHPTATLSGQASTSGLTYGQGGVVGLSNGKQWTTDRWRIGFPTFNVLV